jgi:2TM domain
MNTTPEEEKLYKEARKRVRRKKSYYSAIISYFAVGTFLTFLNWYTQRDEETIHWWVIWVWFGWGIGMFFYTISFFKTGVVFGQDWEDRKIKEEMEKMKRS